MPEIDYSGKDPMTGYFLPGNRRAVGAGNPNAKKIAELNKALLACGTAEVVAELFNLQLAAARGGDHQAGQWLLNKLTGKASQAIELTDDSGKLRIEIHHVEVRHDDDSSDRVAQAPPIAGHVYELNAPV